MRLHRGRAASCVPALCLSPPSAVKLVKVGSGCGAATAGAVQEELAAEALGAWTTGPCVPFMSTSITAGC
eukprot:13096386-Alexandrium_andersonii.AAC.1